MTTVLLALEAPLLRLGARAALTAEGDIEVVGEVDRCEQVVGEVLRTQPDVVLIDGRCQTATNDLLRDLLARRPETRALVMVDHGDDECTLRSLLDGSRGWRLSRETVEKLNECCLLAFRSSARGCVSKTALPERLREAVRLVAAGGRYLPPGLTAHFVDDLRRGLTRELTPAELSAREIEAIGLVADGLANKEIAARLGISEQTVKNHIARIMTKLELRSRTELAVYALREGLA